MFRENEYSHLPHAAAVAQMQTSSILHQVRARAAPIRSPEPLQKPVCHQFPRCEGCPYPGHGFLCWGSETDCMRTRIEKIYKKNGKDMDQSGT